MRRRVFVLMCIMLVLYAFLFGCFAYYQLIEGPRLAAEAAAMRSRRVPLKEYSRGSILDRNLLPLSGSQNTTALYYLADAASDSSSEKTQYETAQKIAPVLGQDCQSIYDMLQAGRRQNSGWVRLAEGLHPDQQKQIEALHMPNLVLAPINRRYRSDGYLAHIIGYLAGGEDPVGAAGVEKLYEDILHHDPTGQQLVSVHDARGLAINGLMYKIRQEQDKQKSSVVLTIDRRIQDIVEEAANRRLLKGAVVVMDVDSKDVLAIVSRPTFNPYQVAQTSMEDAPLLNRALNRYYPGSLFKIAVAAAALEEGITEPDEKFFCSGKYTMPDGFSIPCLRKSGHGKLTLSQAFALSCNPVFIEVGIRLGSARLQSYARKMHLDQTQLIGYQVASYSGIKIDSGQRALANASLGQQGVMMSPLQVCSMVATIADSGKWSPPRLLRYTIDSSGQKIECPAAEKEQVISSQTAALIQSMMEKVVGEGTAVSAAIPEAKVAGKTGTSQTGIFTEKDGEVLDAWFGGYFPAQNPRWAVVVMVEEGKSGARDAAPIFKEIASRMINLLGARNT